MIKIGHFSRISQVPVKTLRFYDEMGLLKPVEVDRFTGYRYYSFDQLRRLNRILALKDLGFSLEQISKLLSQDLPVAELRGMLRMKQEELRQCLQDELARLERVEARLKQLEQEIVMPDYDVVLKKVDPMLVAGVRDTHPHLPRTGVSVGEAGNLLWASRKSLPMELASPSITPTNRRSMQRSVSRFLSPFPLPNRSSYTNCRQSRPWPV
jgi:DNA-binding transcriptional MerR regulator